MTASQRFSRRSFLKGTVSGLAGASVMAAAPAGAQGRSAATAPVSRSPIIRTLGNTGLKAPIVGMGVMNADNPSLVQRAFELGVRHFDTAAYYERGRNEAMVGSVLQDVGGRKEAIIGTKIYVPHAERKMTDRQARDFYMMTAEQSLKRLRTDSIDILYSHSLNEKDWLAKPGILEALTTLKKQGKARAIGFSTHQNMTEMIETAVGGLPYEVILTTFNYSLAEEREFLAAADKAAAKGIGIIAMKTQCQQGWYREAIEQADKSMYQRYYAGPLMNTALLKWALRQPVVSWAVPGYTNFQQIDEDWAAGLDIEYSPEERKFLEDRQVKLAMEAVCRNCGRCTALCPRSVDIAALIRVHMYAASYGNFTQARQVLAEIPAERGLEACGACETCVAACRGRVDIGRRIGQLKSIFLG